MVCERAVEALGPADHACGGRHLPDRAARAPHAARVSVHLRHEAVEGRQTALAEGVLMQRHGVDAARARDVVRALRSASPVALPELLAARV